MMTFPPSIIADESGNSLIEMGLVMPLLAALFVGTVDIAQGVSTKLQLEQAAQRSIELVQRSNYATTMNSTLVTEATTAAGTGSSASATAWLECNHSSTHLDYNTGTCTSTESYARYVKLTVQKSYRPMFGTRFFPNAVNGAIVITGSATVRTQ